MNRFISFLLVSLMPLLLFSQQTSFTEEEKEWIKKHPKIYFGYESDWPPYEMYRNGQYSGIIGDYLKIVEEETGIDFIPIKDITWKESLDKLKSGEIHFVPSCAITPDREKYLEFTNPIVSDPLVIITRREAGYISSLSDLKGKRIALPENYYTQELIKRDFPSIEIVEKPKIIDCLKAVSSGEVDAFFGSLGVVSYYINHNGYTNLKIAAPSKYDDVQIAMACSKDWTTLKSILDKIIADISVQEHNNIRQKWISVRYEYGISAKDVFYYIAIILLVVAVIFGAVFIWNRKLRKEIIKRQKVEKQLSESLSKISKQSEERKILLQEIHHRVKNNLQIISSMLRLQSANSKETGQPFDLDQTIDRINSISLIHEMIYKSDNINIADLEAYFKSLIGEILKSHGTTKNIHLSIKTDDAEIGLQTIVPVAIILNELVVNSIKHAFSETSEGEISLDVKTSGKLIYLIYHDNGKWIAPDKNSNGFGSSLIEIFTEQLDGEMELTTDHGTSYSFVFHQQD